MSDPAREAAPVSAGKALVLGGGGLLGAMYEIGCMAGLEKRWPEDRLDFDLYMGTSCGSVIAALLAAGYTAREVLAMSDSFSPAKLCQLDLRSLSTSVVRLPFELARKIIASVFHGPAPLFEILGLLQEAVPSGLLNLGPLERFIRKALKARGVEDRFSKLPHRLYIPTIDLDTGERLVFGDPELIDERVSTAVAASCATPRFFQPVSAIDRQLVDGGIADTLNLDLIVPRGGRDVLVVNPMVAPLNDRRRRCLPSPEGGCGHVADQGLVVALGQAIKIGHMIQASTSFELHELMHPAVPMEIIQPDRLEIELDDPMDFRQRGRLLALGEIDGVRFALG